MTSTRQPVLDSHDPDPIEFLRPDGTSPVLLLCEHAGNAVPRGLGTLGLSHEDRTRHIAWDLGAAAVTRHLSALLDAPAILQRYSRLVIDCNRPRHVDTLVPLTSDGTTIEANRSLGPDDVQARWEAIHMPFHDTASRFLDRRPNSLIISLHSFTPRLESAPQQVRAMHMGLLHGSDDRLAKAIAQGFDMQGGTLRIAFNEPYAVDGLSDYAIPVHGLARGIPNVLIEIRQDQIAQADQQQAWAGYLQRALIATPVTNLVQKATA